MTFAIGDAVRLDYAKIPYGLHTIADLDGAIGTVADVRTYVSSGAISSVTVEFDGYVRVEFRAGQMRGLETVADHGARKALAEI